MTTPQMQGSLHSIARVLLPALFGFIAGHWSLREGGVRAVFSLGARGGQRTVGSTGVLAATWHATAEHTNGDYPNLPVTQTSPSDVPAGFSSYHHCTNTMSSAEDLGYRRCQVLNVCTYNKQWIYFLAPEKHRQAPVRTDLYGAVQTLAHTAAEPLAMADTRRRVVFQPTVYMGSLQQFAAENGITTVQHHHHAAILLGKHACTNAGHCILENLFPSAINMMQWELPEAAACAAGAGADSTGNCDIFNNLVIMLENADREDCGCGHNPAACGGEGTEPKYLALCNKFVNMYVGALSYATPLYQNQLAAADPEAHTLQCFDRAYVGSGAVGPWSTPRQLESVGLPYMLLRELVLARHSIKTPTTDERRARICRTRKLKVLMHVKEGRRMLKNHAEVAEWTAQHKLVDPLAGSEATAHAAGSFGFDLRLMSWEDVQGGLKPELELLQHTDIYITSAGSAAVNAVFLPEGTARITAPFCTDNVKSLDHCIAAELTNMGVSNMRGFYYVLSDVDSELQAGVPGFYDVIFQKDKYLPQLEAAAVHVLHKLNWQAVESAC